MTSNGRMLLSGAIFTALFGVSVLLVLWIRKVKSSSVEKVGRSGYVVWVVPQYCTLL